MISEYSNLFNVRLLLYQLCATLGTFLTLTVARFYVVRWKRYKLLEYYGIPGPKANLLHGHVYDLFRKDYSTIVEWRKKYGKVFGYFLGDRPCILISDLALIREIYFNRTASFKERDWLLLRASIADGILFTGYDRWRVMRKSMAPAFKKYTIRGTEATQFLETSLNLLKKYLDEKFGEMSRIDIDVLEVMRSFALHLISELAIKLPDVKVGENEPHVKMLDEFLACADGLVVKTAITFQYVRPILQILADNFDVNVFLTKIHKKLDVHIDHKLKQLSEKSYRKQDHEQRESLIDTFIRIHHEGKLTRDEVIGNADTILMAGYDTTSTTLTYIFWCLAKYPHVQEKLREEIKSHGMESKYLEQVIYEVMRLYPVATNVVTRMATETVIIGDVIIPQGAMVVYHAYVMNRNPKVWHEPERFEPDRFQDGLPRDPCVFAPFGLNDRKCLGVELALLSMRMVMSDLILKYKLLLTSPDCLTLVSNAEILSKPREKVIIGFERL